MTCLNREDRIVEIRAEMDRCDRGIAHTDRYLLDLKNTASNVKKERTFGKRRKAKLARELDRLLRFKK